MLWGGMPGRRRLSGGWPDGQAGCGQDCPMPLSFRVMEFCTKLWGGQSWPQPPFRRPKRSQTVEEAEKPAAAMIGRPTIYAAGHSTEN